MSELAKQQEQDREQAPQELIDCDIDFEEVPREEAPRDRQERVPVRSSDKRYSKAFKKVVKVQRMLEQAMILLAEEEARCQEQGSKKGKKQHKKQAKKDKKKAKKLQL